MSKGGGGSTNTVQQADPWVGVQPGLSALYSNALNYYNSGGPQYYPGQTVADQSPATNTAVQNGISRATKGSPVMHTADAANQAIAGGAAMNNPANPYLQSVLNGTYLNSENPYLSGMVNSATNNLAQQYTNTVAPSIASQFSAAGRFGSGQQGAALAQGAQPLAQALQGATSNIYGNAYNTERGLQNQAAADLGNNFNTGVSLTNQATGLAPTLANQDYTDLNALMGIGQYQQGVQQNLINANMAKYNFGQNQPLLNLQALQGLLNGGLQSGSQSQTNSQLPSNPFAQVLGSALAGNSLYKSGAMSALGGLFASSPVIYGAAAGAGAAAGGAFTLAPEMAAFI